MFYDLFLDLCQKKNVAPTRAALDIGLSKSAPIKWRTTGATPQGETLNKIALYFGVSTDYLLGTEQKERPTLSEESELKGVYFNLAKEAQDSEIDPDDIKAAIEIIKKLKNK